MMSQLLDWIPVTSRKIDNLIMKLNSEMNLTSVIVTHDLISALSISSKIMMLHQGKIIEFSNMMILLNQIIQLFKSL